MSQSHEHHAVARIVALFLKGNLSILLIILTMILGAVALVATPREEEPQIVVPMADVMIQVPGADASEVETQVATKLERLLYQIDGVEYVYSMSRPGMAIVTVRFFVGEDREDSLVKLYNKITMHQDTVPQSVAGWVVKPIEIDDVPIVNVTLWSESSDDFQLRRIAEQMQVALQSVPQTGATHVVGGRERQLGIWLDVDALAAHQVTALEIDRALHGANVHLPAGGFDRDNQRVLVESGPFAKSARELKQLVVGVSQGRPVYLSDVARVEDGPAEATNYTRIGFGPGATSTTDTQIERNRDFPAVTIAIAKQKGTNAVRVARTLEAKLESLRGTMIPDHVHATITRNYGETANDKVNELVSELVIAIIIVVGIIALSLGWREAFVVITAVPLTFALTLLVNMLAGYTINRVTLFALILALGLVVDDPIVDVENVYRHLQMRLEPPLRAVFSAVNEVRPPIILATLAVIVSFLPLFFITGMMGPYMRPMALNVPISMLMSMVVAFTVTPWLSYHVMRGVHSKEEKPLVVESTLTYRIYHHLLGPMLDRKSLAWLLILFVCVLVLLCPLLAITGRVPLKMLPFDNKNEFQVVVDMPEGTTLEMTDAAVTDFAAYLRSVREVTQVLTFAGTASPIDFNGLVRHYYLREGPNVGDIRVNLLPKERRQQQSHEILMRLRNDLQQIAERWNANIKLVEVPPGPPVFSTLVAEIYGQNRADYGSIIHGAKHIRRLMESQPGVVDVDDTVEDDQQKLMFVIDKEKASLHGVSAQEIAATVRLGVAGHVPSSDITGYGVGVLHPDFELAPLKIVLRLPRNDRSSAADLERLTVKGTTRDLVQIGELGHFEEVVEDKTIYHKNLERVAYVSGEMVGKPPVDAILGLMQRVKDDPLPAGLRVDWAGEGEWKITLDVFRDLGMAFGAACLGIYILLVWETKSYFMPLLLMIAIPLTIIGILPGFWLLNLLWNVPVGGYPNPVFFTATGMIGMIALSGLATRNAILLIEFIHADLRRGASLHAALLRSGAVRFRPIVLTAGVAMLGAWPITLDPVFSGLAWALIFGLLVSTAFTLILVPVVYWLLYANRPGHGVPTETDLFAEESPAS